MKLHRRQFLHLTVGAAALSMLAYSAWAQGYPTKPVNLIVTFPAGSAPDIIARLAGQWLSERIGQQFVIENKPGFGYRVRRELPGGRVHNPDAGLDQCSQRDALPES